LVHSAEALDKVQACADLEIPLIYAPAPAAGTTAPSSIAATIVVGNAETLSGLVVHQLTNGGAPFVYGVGCGAFDMRTAVDSYGAPEHFLGNAAATDLARFYGLPSFAYAAVADAKLLDEQWAAEAGITAVLGALSRATLLHDVGYIGSGMQSSYETIVLGDELVGYARALLVEVGVDDESLALNEIDAVGPGGSHLGRDYTRQHHRDFWQPALFERAAHERWQAAGATTLKERVAAQAQALREAPRAFTLEASIRERLSTALDEAGADLR
jgi:trimethylamine--corrinoid protein Co-methyltransferase